MMLRHKSAQVLLQFREGYMRVSNLYSMETRKGHASELMQKVVDYADQNGTILVLEAKQFGNPRGMPDHLLKGFYQKFGFVPYGGRTMRREPK